MKTFELQSPIVATKPKAQTTCLPQTVLTLDLGTTTGWALNANGVITSGTMSFKPSRFEGGGMRFLKFTRFLHELNTLTSVSEMYFEEVRRHQGVDAAHAYGGFLAHLSAWCESNSIPYEGVPVGTIKKHATGKGNASKAMMMHSAQRRGHQPTDDNEADAIALLYLGDGFKGAERGQTRRRRNASWQCIGEK